MVRNGEGFQTEDVQSCKVGKVLFFFVVGSDQTLVYYMEINEK